MEYPKVLALGSYGTERALLGPVFLQEKVDGSQFRFWTDLANEIHFGSHRREIHRGENIGMFKEAIEYVDSIAGPIKDFGPSTFYFCEYLRKPKMNCIKYAKTPTNYLVIFDAYKEYHWANRAMLCELADRFNIDVIPELKFGNSSVDEIKELFKADSYLGGDKIEGVVIKNYTEDIMVGGQLRPLFAKCVRPEFKEQNSGEHVKERATLEDFLGGFRSDARWEKAIQCFLEEGKLTNSPKDIGPLIMQIHKDISEEEKDNIGHYLYRHFIQQVLRRATAGFADWYKDRLVARLDHLNKIFAEDTNASTN